MDEDSVQPTNEGSATETKQTGQEQTGQEQTGQEQTGQEQTGPDTEPVDVKPTISEIDVTNPGGLGDSTNVAEPSVENREQISEEVDEEMVNADMDANLLEDEGTSSEWMAEIASYERLTFNLNTELSETKEQLVSTSSKLKDALSQCDNYARDLSERIRLHNTLDLTRNQLSDRNIDLETELARSKQEKESRDNVIRDSAKEKQLLTTEILSLKDQLRSSIDEKTAALLKVEVVEQEKRSLSFEKERAKLDGNVNEQVKIWYVKELGERDSKLAQLRLEIASKELKLQNERIALSNEVKEWQSKIAILEKKNEGLQETVDRFNNSIEQTSENHMRQVTAYEAELRGAHQLITEYRTALDAGEAAVHQLRSEIGGKEQLMEETRSVLKEVQEETDAERLSFKQQLQERDDQLLDLKVELEKANDLLKNKHAVSLNVSELELSTLSPAAAETAKLLKGGMTLTSLMREQARLAGELAAEREKTRLLEQHMQDLLDDIETNAPGLMEQKARLEQMYDENVELRNQLKDADENRRTLENAKDSSLRELAFNRVELEKCQRDLLETTRKNQHLLFVLESDALSREGIVLSEDDERRLFDSIGDLQKVNMRLESELATVKTSAVQSAITAQNVEMERLKSDLENSKLKENRLSDQLQGLTTAFSALEDQSTKLASLAEDNVSANEARESRLRATKAESELQILSQKTIRLKESLKHSQDTLSKTEKNCEERIGLNQRVVSELEMTKAKLESKFEQQKQIADMSLKEIESFEKQLRDSRMEIDDLRKRESEGVEKAVNLMNDLMQMQSQYSECRVNLNVSEEKLRQSLSDTARLGAQLEVFKMSSLKEQQLMLSLNEMNARMSRVESERLVHSNTQGDLRQMEYDSLKQSLARANHQLTQSKNDSQIMQTRLEQQLAALKANLGEKEQLIALNERQISEMTVRLRSVQSLSVGAESTEDMCPERLKMECQQLKNRVQYLESQTEDLKNKLEAAQISVAQKEEELLKISSSSNRLESGVKETQRLGEIERSQLLERAQRAEKSNEEMTTTINQLNISSLEQDNVLTHVKLDAINAQNELNLRIDVLSQQNLEAQQQYESIKAAFEQTRQNLSDKITEYSQYTSEIEALRSAGEEAHSEAEVLRKRLEDYERDLLIAREAARLAEDSRLAHEQSLAMRLEQAESEALRWNKTLTEKDERLQQIIELYEDLVKKHSSVDEISDDVNNTAEPSFAQGISQSHQAVIEFLRREQSSAVERAMKADVDVMRLNAESREIISERDILRNEVNRLKSEEAMHAVLKAEKAELDRRMADLICVQQQFVRIRNDKENLLKQLSEIQKKNSELNQSFVVESGKHAEAQEKVAALNRELVARRQEVDVLKQRVETLNKAAPLSMTQTSNVEQLNQKIKRLEEDAKNNEQQLGTIPKMRDLARKYRSQALAYEKELNDLKQGTSVAGSSGSDNQIEVNRLQALVKELNEKIKSLETELGAKVNDVQEKEFRLNLLTSKIAKNEELRLEIAEKDKLLKNLSLEIEKSKSTTTLPSAAAPSSSSENIVTGLSNVTAGGSVSASSIIGSTVMPTHPAGASFSNESILSSISQKPFEQATQHEIPSQTNEAVKEPTIFKASSSQSEPIAMTSGASVTNLAPGISLFGKSLPKANIWPASSNSNAYSSADELSSVGAEQSSQVSESVADRDLVVGADVNDESAGESRDSAFPVSSTEGKRKRAAPADDVQDVKRLRQSPVEVVTSSEEPPTSVVQEDPLYLEEGEIIQDIDREAVPEMNEEIEEIAEDDDAQATDREQEFDEQSDREGQNVDNLNDEDVDSDMDEEEEFDEDEEEDDDDADVEMIQEVVLSSDSDEPDDDANEAVEYEEEDHDILLADDYDENSQSARLEIADNEDREAASAVEEADDEGRVSADGNIRSESAMQHVTGSSTSDSGSVAQPRLRIPIVFDRDDQCSSSNEASGTPGPSRAPRSMAIRGRVAPRGRGAQAGTSRVSLQSSNESGTGERSPSMRGERGAGRSRGGRRPERGVFRPGHRRGL